MHNIIFLVAVTAGVAKAINVPRADYDGITLPSGWAALGCYNDGWARTLPDKMTKSNSLTIQSCINSCNSAGFAFAGLEIGTECHCGNAISNGATAQSASGCNTPCSGSSSQKCGGGWRLNVFSKSSYDTPAPAPSTPPSGWSSVGCYTDSPTRTLANGYTYTSNSLKPATCISDCAARGFSFAGLENGNECHCSDSIASTGSKASDGDCSKSCTGDASKKCGGGWRLSVFQSSEVKTPTDGWTHEGCYTDDWTRTLQGPSTKSSSMTLSSCKATCFSQKFKYAGVEAGNECYCSNSIPDEYSSARKVGNGDCNMACNGDSKEKCGGGWRVDIYSHPVAESSLNTFRKVGCFVDSANARFLRGSAPQLGNTNSPSACIAECVKGGFGYAGVEYGAECFCGNELWNVQAVDESECNMDCSGAKGEKCGAGNKVMLYEDTVGWCD